MRHPKKYQSAARMSNSQRDRCSAFSIRQRRIENACIIGDFAPASQTRPPLRDGRRYKRHGGALMSRVIRIKLRLDGDSRRFAGGLGVLQRFRVAVRENSSASSDHWYGGLGSRSWRPRNASMAAWWLPAVVRTAK
jgi:hypothetical protein